jgi:hypothetical protein
VYRAAHERQDAVFFVNTPITRARG